MERGFNNMIDKVINFFENVTLAKPVAIIAAIAFVLIIAGLIAWGIVSSDLRRKREENERGWVSYQEFLDLFDDDTMWRRAIFMTIAIALVSVIQTVPKMSKIWEYVVFSFISLALIAAAVLRCFVFKGHILIKKIRKRARGKKVRTKDDVFVTVDEWLEKEGSKIGE